MCLRISKGRWIKRRQIKTNLLDIVGRSKLRLEELTIGSRDIYRANVQTFLDIFMERC